MSAFNSYLKLRAANERQAISKAQFRHVHLSNKPFVVIGYHLAGDVGAPLALMWGTDRNAIPECVIVPEPRDRQCRFEALDKFSCALTEYLNKFANNGRYDEAPQIVTPNRATAEWLFGIVGRFTRNLQSDGSELAAPPSVPLAGKHLSFFHNLQPGSSLVLPATEILSMHWQTGQLSSEDLNLSAALGWIAPEKEGCGPESAKNGEGLPPAGPISDPNWDAKTLSKLVMNWHNSETEAGRADVRCELETEVREQLTHTWYECWQSLTLVSSLPEANAVSSRWSRDCAAWNKHFTAISNGEAYFRNIPTPVQSAKTLSILEKNTTDFHAEMALDDPLVMASYIASGEALSARVLDVDASRKIVPEGKSRRACRPLLVLNSNLPFSRPIGTQLYLTSAPGVEVEILSISGETIQAQVNKGANSSSTFGLLPNVSDEIVLSPFTNSSYYPGQDYVEIPWTHRLEKQDEGEAS